MIHTTHTTRTPAFPKFPTTLVFILLAWLAITAIGYLGVTASTHALIRHGPEALSAQNCFNGSGMLRGTFLDPETGRKASICELRGQFFISIDGPDGGNITMFRREIANCVRDVADYLRQSGFTERP
jgi:hypothetical protein